MKYLTNTSLYGAASLSILMMTACSSPVAQTGVIKDVGDAAVDSVTQNSGIATKIAVRNATGFGTNPVEEKATGILKSLGL